MPPGSRAAWQQVWVDETRPLLQGARLTTYELARAGIPYRLITDSSAGTLMARGMVDRVVVGADRIAANGDVANKVGTYPLAVLAARHGVPFYVAAPLSTVDPATPSGDAIPIEERDAGRGGGGPAGAQLRLRRDARPSWSTRSSPRRACSRRPTRRRSPLSLGAEIVAAGAGDAAARPGQRAPPAT